MSIQTGKQFLIINSRDKQNPNVLGLVEEPDGNVSIKLSVCTEKKIPDNLSSAIWTIHSHDDGGYMLGINHQNQTYFLAVKKDNLQSGSLCTLYHSQSPEDYFLSWKFPYESRLLLNAPNTSLSLDTGAYPNVMVYKFVSSTNQTWGYGPWITNTDLFWFPS